MENELKPCPFCRGKAAHDKITIITPHGRQKAIEAVLCQCGGMMIGLSAEDAAKEWNRRANAVEVVRCEDCKHSDYSGCANGMVYCMEHSCYMDENGFCSDGEREEV